MLYPAGRNNPDGEDKYIRVHDQNQLETGYWHFDLNSIAADASITSARFQLDSQTNSWGNTTISVFARGKYETTQPAGWEDGDWNGDTVFGSGDMVAGAFVAGGYERGLKPGGLNPAVSAVPEPTTMFLMVIGWSVLMAQGRKWGGSWAAQNGIQWWERRRRVLIPNRVRKGTETSVNMW